MSPDEHPRRRRRPPRRAEGPGAAGPRLHLQELLSQTRLIFTIVVSLFFLLLLLLRAPEPPARPPLKPPCSSSRRTGGAIGHLVCRGPPQVLDISLKDITLKSTLSTPLPPPRWGDRPTGLPRPEAVSEARITVPYHRLESSGYSRMPRVPYPRELWGRCIPNRHVGVYPQHADRPAAARRRCSL